MIDSDENLYKKVISWLNKNKIKYKIEKGFETIVSLFDTNGQVELIFNPSMTIPQGFPRCPRPSHAAEGSVFYVKVGDWGNWIENFIDWAKKKRYNECNSYRCSQWGTWKFNNFASYQSLNEFLKKLLEYNGKKVKASADKVFAYHGKVITASSKEEAIQQIVADSKKPTIDMSVVNKWMTKNLNLTDKKLGKDHWKSLETGEVYYTFEAAKRIAKKVPGYHLPTVSEWIELAKACGGICKEPEGRGFSHDDYDNIGELKKKLKIKLQGWSYDGYHFHDVGSSVIFWTASEFGSVAYYKEFSRKNVMYAGSTVKTGSVYLVRLVKD